jgi:hypothetical protein
MWKRPVVKALDVVHGGVGKTLIENRHVRRALYAMRKIAQADMLW